MNLRKNILMKTMLTIFGFLLISFLISQVTLKRSFKNLEEKHLRKDMEQLSVVLTDELNNLDISCHDWSAWDDTYQYIQNKNADYSNSNLQLETMQTLAIDYLLMYNTSENPVLIFSQGFNYQSGSAKTISPQTLKTIERENKLFQFFSPKHKVSGLINLPEGIALLSARPITKSDGTGPILGTLIMIRLLNSGMEAKFRHSIMQDIFFYNYKGQALSEDVLKIRKSLTTNNKIVQNVSENRIAIYSLLSDINKIPVLIVKLEEQKDIINSGNLAIYSYLFNLILLGLILLIVFYYIVDNTIIKRIAHLTNLFSNISKSSDLTLRVEIQGNDELCYLGKSVNNMLDQVLLKENDLEMRNYQTKLLVENMPVMINAFDEKGNLIVWNKESENVSGYTAQEMLNNPQALEYIFPSQSYRDEIIKNWLQTQNDYRDWILTLTTKDKQVKYILSSNISEVFPIPGWPSWSIGVDITYLQQTKHKKEILIKELKLILSKLKDYRTQLYEHLNLEIDDIGKLYLNQIDESFERISSLFDEISRTDPLTRE